MPAPPEPSTRSWLNELAWLRSIPVAFVVGPMKTGTSWLSRTINAHPQAICRHESHQAEVLWPSLRRAFDDYERTLEKWGRQADTGLTEVDHTSILRLSMDLQLLRYARAAGRVADPTLRLVADKTPMHALNMTEIASVYPDAKFICCTRDPRDAAVSAWKHLHEMLGHRRDATFEDYARHYVRQLWAAPIRAAREATHDLGSERVFFVSYERHTCDPHALLRELFDFLGLESDSEIVAGVAARASFTSLTNRAPGVEARSPHRKGIVGDWINHMTPEFGDALLRLAEESLGKGKEPPHSTREGSSDSVSSHAAA